MIPSDYRDVPIFINNFNRLDIGFRDLLVWLQRAGQRSIAVIDNNSTYKPLLQFYDSGAMTGIQLIRSAENLGHEAIWKLGLHNRADGLPFIYTDPDVVPDHQCPLDLVRKMCEVFVRYAPCKVGPAIRIDDIPATFDQRDHMRFCESDYWLRRYPEGDCWNAPIDTVFAVYACGWGRWPLADQGGVQHVRLDFPYVVRHIPWYSQSDNLSAEERYYRAHVENGYSSSCPVAIPE
jgi:hypothetical protein